MTMANLSVNTDLAQQATKRGSLALFYNPKPWIELSEAAT
jgi:hypothetical protein